MMYNNIISQKYKQLVCARVCVCMYACWRACECIVVLTYRLLNHIICLLMLVPNQLLTNSMKQPIERVVNLIKFAHLSHSLIAPTHSNLIASHNIRKDLRLYMLYTCIMYSV